MQLKTVKPASRVASAAARHASTPSKTHTSQRGMSSTLLRLQGMHGNRFVQRLMGGTSIQRKCACQSDGAPPEQDLTPIVQRKSHGRSLEPGVRAFMESRFDQDFSRVRVHDDEHSAESATQLNASAYTVGPDIFFGRAQYSPQSQSGRQLLAHELTHVLQQAQMPAGSGTAQLRVSEPGDAMEREADSIADAVVNNRQPGEVRRVSSPTIARRGPMPRPPVQAPPVQAPGPRERYATPPGNSWAEMAERAERRRLGQEAIREGERPIATLERGGSAPDFVTVLGRASSVGAFGQVSYDTYAFHILDAIEYQVGRANTERDLENILLAYVTPGHPLLPLNLLFPVLRFPDPVIPDSVDPHSVVRLRVYTEAVARRARQVPALQRVTRTVPQTASEETTRRRCTVTPASGLGNDPLATIFCQAATNTLFEYRVTSPTAGSATFDAMRGNTVYECKCGYASLVRTHGRSRGFAALQLDRMDEQVRRHLRIAQDCGLQYRFIVSNPELANILRERWFDVVVLEHPFEPCD